MEPMQMKRRKKGAGYNLRKSLAWDRAFFTDEGILDPLELTLITGIDANTCGRGLSTISEEGNSSFSSDASSTNESNDTEASREAPLKGLRDKNCTTKANREKAVCSMINHGSLLHRRGTHKVLSSDHTNRGGAMVGGCSEPLAVSSLKRPANTNTLTTAKKESKLPKLPKPGSYTTAKGSMAARQLRHNLIPKPTKNDEQNFGLKSSVQNVHGSQSKAKAASGNVHLPVRELAQKTVKSLTHLSKAASSTRSRMIKVDRANGGSKMVPDTSQLCKVQEESALHAKCLGQHYAATSNNSFPEAARLSSSGPCHIQRDSKGQMISDGLNSCESRERPATLARPSGLRLPSPSLRLFGQNTASQSVSLQQKKDQHYMGSTRKCGEPWPLARTPMKSNDITENTGCEVLTSSKESCAPSTKLGPSPNYISNTSTTGAPDSIIYQNIVQKIVPTVGIKLEYECGDSEQQKKISGHEETAVNWKGEEGRKVSHLNEQLAGNVLTCQLTSKAGVPKKDYKYMLHNEEDGLRSYTTFSMSTYEQSNQYQEVNILTGVDDLVQTSRELGDAEKSDDAPSKVNPEAHLDAGSQVFVESQEQDGIIKREDDVGTTKCVAPDIENYSAVLQHGQKNSVPKVVDGKSLLMEEDENPCDRRICEMSRDSHSIEHEADVIELEGIHTSSIPLQNLNTEQRNDDADGVDVPPTATTTSPCVRDPSAEEGNGIHIDPSTFIRSKALSHHSPVRDNTTQFLNHNPSAEGFNIEPTTSFKNEHQLPGTPLLHDNPSSPDRHHNPTNSNKNKSQLQDTHTANGSPKHFEATTPCISALLYSQLSEEGTFRKVTDSNDHFFHEKSVSSAILSEVPGHKQDGVNVDLIPREVAPLVDDHNLSSGLSHLRPQLEFVSETAFVDDDALVKRESVLQRVQCNSSYPRSLEKERLDIAVPTVEAQHTIPAENKKSQEMEIFVAEKLQASHGNISEAKTTFQGCTGGSETHSLTSSKECCAPSTKLSPPPNYILKTNTREAPDLHIYQNLVQTNVPRVGTKLEYEHQDSEQEKTISTWKGEEGSKVSHPTEQLAGNVGTCPLISEARVLEKVYKAMLHNEEDGLRSYITFSLSKYEESTQYQKENILTGVDDLVQIARDQADTEKSDDAPSKVYPYSHLDAGSQVFVESQEQDGSRKREDDVGTTKCVALGMESYSVVLQHGQENSVSKVVAGKSLSMVEDDNPCSRKISVMSSNSHFLEHEADVIELEGIHTSPIPFPNLNTDQKNDDADGVDVLSTITTTSPCVRDPSAEEGNGIHFDPSTFIRSKAPSHHSPVRDNVTQLLNDSPSADGFNIEPTTSFENEHQLPGTPLLHDNLSSPDHHLNPTNSNTNKSQLQDTHTANGSPKRFEATTPCISALLYSQLSEEGTFHNVTDSNDHFFHEKSVSSAILSEVSGQKQDGFDVDLIPREVTPLVDDHNLSSCVSHLRPQLELISETAFVGDDALVKRESVQQRVQCNSTYPQSLEKERLDIAAPTVEAQHNIPAEIQKSREMEIFVVAEKLQAPCGNISEANPAVQGCTGGSDTHSLFQSENETLECSVPISNISKTNVEDGQVQLLDSSVIVQSCSRSISEVHNYSIENADHSEIHRRQAGFSSTAIKVEQVSKSNHENFQQESVCKAVWNAVEGNDVDECDLKLPNSIIVDAALPIVEEIGNSGGQLCVEYRPSGSEVIVSIAEHNDNCSEVQSTECGDLTLDSKLEPSVEDKTFVENSTCMEYCSAGEELCSFLTESILEENTMMFLDEGVLMKGSLLSTENLDGVIVSEENSDASAQSLPVLQVNGDNQPQGFVGKESNSSFSVSQESTAMGTTRTPELCCLIGGGAESLLTKTTNMIEAEGSKIIIREQVDATSMVGEFQHELDDVKDRKDVMVLTKSSNSIKMQDNSLVIHPPNAVPFSDEWLAAFEAAGEEILTMKCGAVQHSPPDKSLPEPSPWSPVKKKGNQIGPYDCTKYTNAMP